MSTTLGKWMTLIISITIMFTPILAYVDSMHREAIEITLLEGAKKVALEGYLTETIKDSMMEELATRYNFDRDEIVLEQVTPGALTPHGRGTPITLRISVDRVPIFLFDIFNNGPTKTIKETTIMSEYIN